MSFRAAVVAGFRRGLAFADATASASGRAGVEKSASRDARSSRRGGAELLIVLLLAGCGPAVTFAPYRACLFQRNARGVFDTGTVVGKDEDLRLRFRYDDPAWGDHDDPQDPRHGFIWVGAGDGQRVIRPCLAAAGGFMDIDAAQPSMPAREAPPIDHELREQSEGSAPSSATANGISPRVVASAPARNGWDTKSYSDSSPATKTRIASTVFLCAAFSRLSHSQWATR
jgi:hypothetical protein